MKLLADIAFLIWTTLSLAAAVQAHEVGNAAFYAAIMVMAIIFVASHAT